MIVETSSGSPASSKPAGVSDTEAGSVPIARGTVFRTATAPIALFGLRVALDDGRQYLLHIDDQRRWRLQLGDRVSVFDDAPDDQFARVAQVDERHRW